MVLTSHAPTKKPPHTGRLSCLVNGYDATGISEAIGEFMSPVEPSEGATDASGLLTGTSEAVEESAGAFVGAGEAAGSVEPSGWAAMYCSCNTTVSSISWPLAS
jgi:hypothetical protein